MIAEIVQDCNLSWQCSLIQNRIADFYNSHFKKCIRNFDLAIIEYWIQATTQQVMVLLCVAPLCPCWLLYAQLGLCTVSHLLLSLKCNIWWLQSNNSLLSPRLSLYYYFLCFIKLCFWWSKFHWHTHYWYTTQAIHFISVISL